MKLSKQDQVILVGCVLQSIFVMEEAGGIHKEEAKRAIAVQDWFGENEKVIPATERAIPFFLDMAEKLMKEEVSE